MDDTLITVITYTKLLDFLVWTKNQARSMFWRPFVNEAPFVPQLSFFDIRFTSPLLYLNDFFSYTDHQWILSVKQGIFSLLHQKNPDNSELQLFQTRIFVALDTALTIVQSPSKTADHTQRQSPHRWPFLIQQVPIHAINLFCWNKSYIPLPKQYYRRLNSVRNRPCLALFF